MSVRFLGVLLGVCLVSFSSFACPDLSGKWVCENNQPNFFINYDKVFDTDFLKLNVVGGYEKPEQDPRVFILDAGPQMNDGESYEASCKDNSVVIHLREQITPIDTKGIKEHVQLTYSFILQDSNTLVMTLESPDIERGMPTTCKRFSPLK